MWEEEEGAIILATDKALSMANSEEAKVSMTDATFQCCPKKENTGIYQMLIFHVIRHDAAIPIMHVPMSCKTESLYTKIMEWLRQQCPLLKPENMNVDFELAIINSAEEVFQLTPKGCDFHYNQAVYRKFRQMGLRPILTRNANFGNFIVV